MLSAANAKESTWIQAWEAIERRHIGCTCGAACGSQPITSRSSRHLTKSAYGIADARITQCNRFRWVGRRTHISRVASARQGDGNSGKPTSRLTGTSARNPHPLNTAPETLSHGRLQLPAIERGPSASRRAPCEPRWAIRRPTHMLCSTSRANATTNAPQWRFFPNWH